MGFFVDDPRIKDAYKYAKKEKINIEFTTEIDPDRHPNAVDIKLYNESSMLISGNSLGAGEVQISNINSFKVNLRGDFPTLLLIYKDQPGMIWKVSKVIQDAKINIASLTCERNEKGKEASMTICLDSILTDELVKKIEDIAGMYTVRNIDVLEK